MLPETQPIDQPQRTIDPGLARAIIAGGYWLSEPGPGADLATAYCGAVVQMGSESIFPVIPPLWYQHWYQHCSGNRL